MRRLGFGRDRYVELEEAPAVLTPLHPTTVLLPEHFSTPLPTLRYPVKLDFAHERFRLRSLALLREQLNPNALQEIDLSDNELQSLVELNRFAALKSLCDAATTSPADRRPADGPPPHAARRLGQSADRVPAAEGDAAITGAQRHAQPYQRRLERIDKLR